MHPAPELRPHCPACSKPSHLVRDERLAGEGTLVYLRCTACRWEQLEPHGSRAAHARGSQIYDAAMQQLREEIRSEGARLNAEREARERQQAIADAEAIVRGWADGPVGNRVANYGTGYVVALPRFENGITWEELSPEVRTACDRASAEAETEAARLNAIAAAQRAERPALERQAWAEQAARDRKEHRRLRERRSDVELSR